jgi:phosphatidate cytidylyltransferase
MNQFINSSGMVITIYILLLIYFLVGTIGIYLINRKKEKLVARKAWIKHIMYFVIINVLFFSIVINPAVFHYIAILIIVVSFWELYKLYRDSGFVYGYFFGAALGILAVFSLGFYCFSINGKGLILFAFVILSIFDGFSQVSGQLFGKTKLMPKVSPYKTIEGLIGGTLVAVLSSLIFKNLINASTLKSILLAVVVVVFAFAGDLLKSYYKRKYNVKDFSNLIPGHGGFLDRFDSLIAGGAGAVLAALLMNL